MAYTDINSEDRLVQETLANYLHDQLGWESVYAWNEETFGPSGTLGRDDTREAVLRRDLRAALERLNPTLPTAAREEALNRLAQADISRSLFLHNRQYHEYIREGVPVEYRDAQGMLRSTRAKVIDFGNRTSADGRPNNRFLAVRELKLTGLRAPSYSRRADLVCFVNGLPLVFFELKAVYKNIRAGFDGNLRDYLDEHVISHAFHHNAFLIVSNGHRARYGSITSAWEHFAEWKRNDEDTPGSEEAQVLLDGMLAHDRLLDLVENFILFDSSKAGKPRKVIARNHQVLGVNLAVDSVRRQERLKAQFPPELRLKPRFVELTAPELSDGDVLAIAGAKGRDPTKPMLQWVESVHPDLGKLGVFWHTQGSGKSYSILFFTEKVRRTISAKFTFLLLTDREDLDDQIYRTFAGCGVADPKSTPRARDGGDLRRLLGENHRYVFSLIQKFNQQISPREPYSRRDDIIVITDEAHRTQAGKFARNLRLALPHAAFIGFTGTPLFKHDHLTRRIFGGYVSRYDFRRSEQDGATVRLVYENRGEKLGLARLDLNDRIAEAITQAELDPDKQALLEKLLGQDYEVITADHRLDRLADDFVEHCTTRWESGKSMLVCIDKVTCGRMHQRIVPRWKVKLAKVRAEVLRKQQELAVAVEETRRERLAKETAWLEGQAKWLESTYVGIVISEGQNEVADFQSWGCDIIPHRTLMKRGFETSDGKRMDVESAFKNPDHPFRVAIVCAMWLTGFDVECLSTLYLDKPMKAHTLMQAIARANRVFPNKDFGLLVDYNGMLKSLREALAQYALGDGAAESQEVVSPIEERVQALQEAILETESHLRGLGFETARFHGALGFARIAAIADAVEAVYRSDESKRRFEILARQVFCRFKALVMEPAAQEYAERHDNLETIYKKLTERRDTADVSDLLKELHRIVNEAVRTQELGEDQLDSRLFDLSRIDFGRLQSEFAKKVRHPRSAVRDLRRLVEGKIAQMLSRNPLRMDYFRRYSEIIADYNREKDRVTVEETFGRLVDLLRGLSAEELRAAEEGLTEEELAVFDLLKHDNITRVERERVKHASQELLDKVRTLVASVQDWTEKEQTRAEVESCVRDHLHFRLPSPPFSEAQKEALAGVVYAHLWQQQISAHFAPDRSESLG